MILKVCGFSPMPLNPVRFETESVMGRNIEPKLNPELAAVFVTLLPVIIFSSKAAASVASAA